MPKSIVLGLLTMIITLGCASTLPVTKYLPREDENVLPFFSAGQPIAALETTTEFILLAVEPVIMFGDPYVRLWVLFNNRADDHYLLEPLKFATLEVTSKLNEKLVTSEPESPTKILAHIKNEKAVAQIMLGIGGALQSIGTSPTKAQTKFSDGSSATTTFNDSDEKRSVIVDKTLNSMTNTALWYDIYANSISEGILKRNTIFSGQSVNGYIYFAVPKQIFYEERKRKRGPSTGNWAHSAYDDTRTENSSDSMATDAYDVNTFDSGNYLHDMNLVFTLNLDLPDGQMKVVFAPIEGE